MLATVYRVIPASATMLRPGSIKITGYVRFDKGEGIQKREEDYGAEIAKLVNG
jgi:elongation factor Ts